MEGLVGMRGSVWNDCPVLITGHTGFKGGWLSLWLHRLGARVHGYARDIPTVPSLFEAARVAGILATDTRADLADLERLRRILAECAPSVVFHLAAQSIVRGGYSDPIGTLASNVMGTANVLEAVRGQSSVRAVVIITTDKVYENQEWIFPYREIDHLGGHDPYSASKAAAEVVTASYRSSYFGPGKEHGARVATARAGNVIGGGDWACDRLVPDCLRAFAAGEPLRLRYPSAVRPWQHVLEPLAGYLRLAEVLLENSGENFAEAWNFGPDARGDVCVEEVARALACYWGGEAKVEPAPSSVAPHEASQLRLDSSAARTRLKWWPRWSLDDALESTVEWHKNWLRGDDMREFSLQQIASYAILEQS